jgi:hypothetical protein
MIEGPQERGSARRVRETRRRRRRIVFAVALALCAGAAWLSRDLWQRPGEAAPGEARIPAPEPGATGPAPEAPAEAAVDEALAPAEPLPALDESDAFARARAAAVSSRPELAGWLAGEGLVTRFVAAVDAVANGESPRSELPELAPRARFEAEEHAGHPALGPRAAARYDVVAAVFESLDAEACARVHRALAPLFEKAHAQIGHRGDDFDATLARAFRELLRAPVRDGDFELAAGIRSYHFADPALEDLSPAQKQLLRMGPRNARRVQAKLRELATALGLDVSDAATGPAH